MATAVVKKQATTLSRPQTNGKTKKKITLKERNKAIAEISASIKKSFSKKYLNDWLR